VNWEKKRPNSENIKDGLKFIKDNVDAYAKFNEAVLIKEYDKELPFKGGFAFLMYESYGFPPEMTLEELKMSRKLKGKLMRKNIGIILIKD